ncbi:hypothetical protein, conserved [Eimeria tenella]|uniref:Methyltransferase type 11 domain-containing protein n=1 Tax=Eimeria tenella TaxID=5802 RepID=U6KGI9_EIMTE|nr:hypothetical protein, conserved [Eimeria tenella]CDJ37160.1 hypothetical protein, conserved [Eimeria tenella]|eukprot:XP_013227998.1 hypothetical protein, conserved [Eimeria tenella]
MNGRNAIQQQQAEQSQQEPQQEQQEKGDEHQQKLKQEKRERRQQQQQRRRQQLQKCRRRPESLPVPSALLGAAFERQHVDSVYAKIAPHFNHTRNRPWPKVAAFIESLPPDALLLDVGCGNGKYLHCRPSICHLDSSSGGSSTNCFSPYSSLSIGLDRSKELLRCASEAAEGSLRPRLVQADCLHTPMRDGVADGVICIAVLHHLTTEERRLQALRELARITRCGGRILIYVWALEHQSGSVGERKFPSQDVLVPWVYQKHHERARERSEGVAVCQGTTDTDGPVGANSSAVPSLNDEDTVYRFYRVFTREELLGLCAKEERVRVLDCYNDTNNWAVVLEKCTDQ